MRTVRLRRVPTGVPLCSMSDISFLLIIFFALAGRFSKVTEKDIVLPVADMGERTPTRDIELVVTKDNEFLVNGSRVEPGALQEEINSYLVPDTPRESRTVTVFADRDAPYGAVSKAIEAVNHADAYLELGVLHSR